MLLGISETTTENPPHSRIAFSMPEEQRPRTGCLILFVPMLIVMDIAGMLAACAGPYVHVVSVLGLGAFAFGGILGYFSAKAHPESRYTPSFWVVSWGLIVTLLVVAITFILMAHAR